jgi:hypothetical protein
VGLPMLMREVGSSRDVRARPALSLRRRGGLCGAGLWCGVDNPGGDGGVPEDTSGDDDVEPAQQGGGARGACL